MGLFLPYEQGKTEPEVESTPEKRSTRRQGSTAEPAPISESTVAAADLEPTRPKGPRPPAKKGTRTPTRAEAEAARMARLHPTLSPKEQKKAEREANREARMANLSAADQSRERVLLRDHIDSRWTLPEFTMPIFAVLLVLLFTLGRNDPRALYWMNLALTALLLLMALNIGLVWRSYKKLAIERGLQPKQRGMFMYAMNRMMAFRAIRQPRPRISRGDSY